MSRIKKRRIEDEQFLQYIHDSLKKTKKGYKIYKPTSQKKHKEVVRNISKILEEYTDENKELNPFSKDFIILYELEKSIENYFINENKKNKSKYLFNRNTTIYPNIKNIHRLVFYFTVENLNITETYKKTIINVVEKDIEKDLNWILNVMFVYHPYETI